METMASVSAFFPLATISLVRGEQLNFFSLSFLFIVALVGAIQRSF